MPVPFAAIPRRIGAARLCSHPVLEAHRGPVCGTKPVGVRPPALAPDPSDHFGLVFHIARQMHVRLRDCGVAMELDDLVQEGMVGLIQATQSYDPQVGVTFATYAYPRVAGAIKDALRRGDPLSQDQRVRVRQLQRTRDAMWKTMGRAPLEGEVTDALEITPEALRRLEQAEVAGAAAGPAAPTSIVGVAAGQAQDLVLEQLGAATRACMATVLDPTEKKVLLLRFWAGLTLEKVGHVVQMDIQRVHRAEMRARRKVRACLAARDWEVDDVLETLADPR